MNYYAVVRSGSDDTLEHFGVLGMRWGVRHDRRVKMAKARFKTDAKAIKKDKSLNKTQRTRKIAASREQWMKEREKALNRKIARDSSKKTLAKSLMFGSKGAAAYNSRRGKGGSRISAGLRGYATSLVSNLNPVMAIGTEIGSLDYYRRNRAARKKKK